MIQLGPSEQAAKTSQANLTVMITTNRSLSRSYSGTLTHSLTAKISPSQSLSISSTYVKAAALPRSAATVFWMEAAGARTERSLL